GQGGPAGKTRCSPPARPRQRQAAAAPDVRTASAEAASLRCAFRVRGGGLVVRHEHITEAPDRLDIARVGGVGLDQLAQPGHLDVDGAIEYIVVATAREQRELLACQRLARVL